jgi:hypothetical protein
VVPFLRRPVHWNIKTAGLQTLRGKLRRLTALFAEMYRVLMQTVFKWRK